MLSERRRPRAYMIEGPDGQGLAIPRAYHRDADAYPPIEAAAALRGYFDREGYVVARDLIPPALCDAVVESYTREVKPDRGFFLRHASGKPERHVFTEHGHMKFPIMNLQDLPVAKFANFRRHGLALLAHDRVQPVIQALLGEPGRIIHTMFFDGNQKTWAHHDSYYLDSEQIGAMIGLWVALEDIHPGAGRFYVCPRSHLLDLPVKGRDTDLDPNGEAYKGHVLRLIRENELECRAPALRKGDAILWSARTIHGSLCSPEPRHSRRSLTCHYIPRSHDFLWLHSYRPEGTKECTVNGVPVTQHYDLNVARHRLAYFMLGTFPGLTAAAMHLRRRLR